MCQTRQKSQSTNNAYKVCARELTCIRCGDLKGSAKFLPCLDPRPHTLPPNPTNPLHDSGKVTEGPRDLQGHQTKSRKTKAKIARLLEN